MYLDAGSFERGIRDPSILLYNRHLRDVLRAKGYAVVYAEFTGGHDYVCWQGTLASGLIALVGRSPIGAFAACPAARLSSPWVNPGGPGRE